VAGGVSQAGHGHATSVSARLLSVLGAFDRTHQRLTLTDLARRAGLPLSTAHRLVGELERWGGLSRCDDGAYQVGGRLWELGLLAPVQRDLREIALPYLQDVHSSTRQTVHLAVRQDRHALYVERLLAPSSTAVVSRTGARLPLHATAVGKVLLAHAPQDVQADVLQDLKRITPRTVVDAAVLSAQLDEVRQCGYARTAEEMTRGSWSIAVPLRDQADDVVAAIGLVAGSASMQLLPYVAVLQVAASAVARRLPPGWSHL
jgi:DNA-binding IclR family transcriptional regulator